MDFTIEKPLCTTQFRTEISTVMQTSVRMHGGILDLTVQ